MGVQLQLTLTFVVQLPPMTAACSLSRLVNLIML